MKLAIVIPFYKKAFFESTLISLVNQSDTRFNLYVGNDCSPDDVEELLKKYNTELNIHYTYFETNLGGRNLAEQWSRCIDMINEESWITILGDDDLLPPNFIRLFHENIAEVLNKGIEVIRFSSKYIDEQGNSTISDEIFTHPTIEKSTDAFFRNHLNLSRSSLSEYVFSKKSYDVKGFTNYPLAWHSDDKAWLDFSNFGNIYSINDEYVSMRMSTLNISGKKSNERKKWESKILFYTYITSDNALKKFNKLQQKKLLIDFCSYLKMVKKLNFLSCSKIALKLMKLSEFYSILQVAKVYFKHYKNYSH